MAAREYSYLAVDINALFRAKDKWEAQERRSRLQSKRERVRGRFGIDADARAGNLHDPFWLRGSSPENSPRLCATSSSSSSRTGKDAASLSPTQRHERQHADRRPRTTPTRWGEHSPFGWYDALCLGSGHLCACCAVGGTIGFLAWWFSRLPPIIISARGAAAPPPVSPPLPPPQQPAFPPGLPRLLLLPPPSPTRPPAPPTPAAPPPPGLLISAFHRLTAPGGHAPSAWITPSWRQAASVALPVAPLLACALVCALVRPPAKPPKPPREGADGLAVFEWTSRAGRRIRLVRPIDMGVPQGRWRRREAGTNSTDDAPEE